jgi:hypothetical protein
MNKPRINRKSVKEKTLAVTLTESEKEAIEKEANKAYLSMSAWARSVLLEKINQK